jgi:hypothetical protein
MTFLAQLPDWALLEERFRFPMQQVQGGFVSAMPSVIVRDERDLAGARADFKRALTINEQNPGREHPTTQGVLSNLRLLPK